MRVMVVTLEDKKTGEHFGLTVPLNGTKKHQHLLKEIRKTIKGARVVRVVVKE